MGSYKQIARQPAVESCKHDLSSHPQTVRRKDSQQSSHSCAHRSSGMWVGADHDRKALVPESSSCASARDNIESHVKQLFLWQVAALEVGAGGATCGFFAVAAVGGAEAEASRVTLTANSAPQSVSLPREMDGTASPTNQSPAAKALCPMCNPLIPASPMQRPRSLTKKAAPQVRNI